MALKQLILKDWEIEFLKSMVDDSCAVAGKLIDLGMATMPEDRNLFELRDTLASAMANLRFDVTEN